MTMMYRIYLNHIVQSPVFVAASHSSGNLQSKDGETFLALTCWVNFPALEMQFSLVFAVITIINTDSLNSIECIGGG